METISENTLLLCPVCNSTLVRCNLTKVYKCINNHSYDIAKGNYVNLLMSNKKKSKNPGDPKEMVTARKDFLSKGYYAGVSNKINDTVIDSLGTLGRDAFNILDLGCGEGYYLSNMVDHFKEKEVNANCYGMDISKSAIIYASKIVKDSTLIVGNNFAIPLEDNSIDCILSVFSPIDVTECMRILKDEGFFIRVFPEKNHLIQLKEIIYSQITDKAYQQYKLDEPGIKLVEQVNVTYDINLNKEDLLNLLKMTPHYWRVKKEDKENFDSYDSLVVTVDMCIGVFKKDIR